MLCMSEVRNVRVGVAKNLGFPARQLLSEDRQRTNVSLTRLHMTVCLLKWRGKKHPAKPT